MEFHAYPTVALIGTLIVLSVATFSAKAKQAVRYTDSLLSFNLAGILGASLAPYIATWLAKTYGLQYVGYYLSTSAVLTPIGLLLIRETKDDDLASLKL